MPIGREKHSFSLRDTPGVGKRAKEPRKVLDRLSAALHIMT